MTYRPRHARTSRRHRAIRRPARTTDLRQLPPAMRGLADLITVIEEQQREET